MSRAQSFKLAFRALVATVFPSQAKAIGFPMSTTFDVKDPQLAQLFTTNYSSAGVAVTEKSALQVSTVWACVKVLAETIGGMPFGVYQRDDDGDAIKVQGHIVEQVFENTPNVYMTSVEYREAKVSNLCLWGNGYSIKETRKDKSLISLMPIVSSIVTPKRANDGTISYDVNDRGKNVNFPAEKIWHVKGFGSNGLMGYSPIGYARQCMGVALATDEFQAKFFVNGAMASFFVTIAKWLSPTERQQAFENLNRLISGTENAYRTHLLEGGMVATPATMPLKDAQFMELKGMTIEDICRYYRMPLHMVGELKRSTNNNIEQQALEFVMYTLGPWLKRIQASANRWLLSPEDRAAGLFTSFDVDELLLADIAARSTYLSQMLQNGVMNRNEARKIARLPSVDDPAMDEYTVQVNLTPIDQLATVAAAAAQGAIPKPAGAPQKRLTLVPPPAFEDVAE